MKIIAVGPARRAELGPRIAALEESAWYPLGADRFRIDHGADYFAFFARLGALRFYAALDGERVAAVGAAVLRTRPIRSWYLCDLKVHPDYRGQRIPLRILTRAFPLNYLRCPRGYAISMNPGDGRPNPIVRLLGRFRWAPNALAANLLLYQLDAAEMRAAAPVMQAHRGTVSYLSLAGRKDIVLESTGRPMPLFHAQFGPCAEAGGPTVPQDGATHMFYAVEGDALHAALTARGLKSGASSSLIAHRMGGTDWSWILTSDV